MSNKPWEYVKTVCDRCGRKSKEPVWKELPEVCKCGGVFRRVIK